MIKARGIDTVGPSNRATRERAQDPAARPRPGVVESYATMRCRFLLSIVYVPVEVVTVRVTEYSP